MGFGNTWGWGGGFHEISDKLKGDNAKDHEDAEDLHEVGFVVVEEDAEGNGENLPGGDNERHKMLFELFDHSVYEHLTDQCQDTHYDHVEEEEAMRQDEFAYIDELPEYE